MLPTLPTDAIEQAHLAADCSLLASVAQRPLYEYDGYLTLHDL
jgi:hypothetical protein